MKKSKIKRILKCLRKDDQDTRYYLHRYSGWCNFGDEVGLASTATEALALWEQYPDSPAMDDYYYYMSLWLFETGTDFNTDSYSVTKDDLKKLIAKGY